MSTNTQPTLLCYDGSASAKRAIAVAAATLGSGRFVVLNVWNEPLEALPDSYSDRVRSHGTPVATLEHLAVERATEIVDEGQELASSLGLETETHLEPAHAGIGQGIVHAAERLDAKLIVLGTHGRTAAERELLGSVSAVVLASSRRPVLVVPRAE